MGLLLWKDKTEDRYLVLGWQLSPEDSNRNQRKEWKPEGRKKNQRLQRTKKRKPES